MTLKLGAIEASPFGALTLLGDGFAWFVPAFVAGVPGILILLIVLLQLAGGVIWAPAVRRFRDQSGQPTRRSTQSS